MGESRGFRPFDFVARAARNSPWVLIAAAAHVLVLAGAAIFYTAHHGPPPREEAGTFRIAPSAVVEQVEVPPVPEVRIPIPRNVEAELSTLAPDPYLVDQNVVEDLSQEAGDPDADSDVSDVGGSSPIGAGEGGIRRPRVSTRGGPGYGDRNPQGVKRRIETVKTYEAVLQGLRWLARHQNADGSWSPATLNENCPCDDPAYNPKRPYGRLYDTGLTSLALLAFLGAGFSHESKLDLVDTTTARRHKIGTIVKKGLQWLVARQNPDGSFTPDRAFLYNEALAAMAVSEAYGLTQARPWREPAQRSLDFLQRAQRPSPTGVGLWGWRYASRMDIEQFHRGAGSQDAEQSKDLYDADTSVTGWAVMALKSGQLSGLRVSPDALAGGLAFANHVTQLGADGRPTGLAGYLDAQGAGAKVTGPNDQFVYHPASMAALGMCIRIFGNHDPEDPFLKPAAEQIVKDLPAVSKDGLSLDYYYWYYASLALNQVDGPDAPKRSGRYWPAWNKAMVDALLGLQSQEKRSCTSGGWMAPDRWSLDHGGPLYATALNVLTLEVYYRYENAFGGAKRN
ncbi:MAG: terpene cyclase/mutase family protein [Planctomycetota bacterium]|nr:terpene cyclase/mutase family protein [Planctomycetota bacterium]